jgi:hypothetical protein
MSATSMLGNLARANPVVAKKNASTDSATLSANGLGP